MPQEKDLKRRVRARIQETGERYTTARAAIEGDRSASSGHNSIAVARRRRHPGVMRLFKEGRWDFLIASAAAYRCAMDSGNVPFAGRYVLREFGYWLPSLQVLRRYGIIEKDGDSVRGGNRAYYRMPEPEAVAAALRSIGVPLDVTPTPPGEVTPGTEWMSDALRLFAAMVGEQRLKDLDLRLRLALDEADDEGEVAAFRRLRDELWQHQFNRPSPSPDKPAGVDSRQPH
jgi:hypothetical protein